VLCVRLSASLSLLLPPILYTFYYYLLHCVVKFNCGARVLHQYSTIHLTCLALCADVEQEIVEKYPDMVASAAPSLSLARRKISARQHNVQTHFSLVLSLRNKKKLCVHLVQRCLLLIAIPECTRAAF